MNNIDIENIIKEKLNGFEYKSSSSDWDVFEKKLPKKKINFSKYLIAAATIAVIAVFIAYNINDNDNKQQTITNKNIITNNTKNINLEPKKENTVSDINTNSITAKENTKKNNIIKENNIEPRANNTINKESSSQKDNISVENIAVKPNKPDVIIDNYKPNAKFTSDKTQICIPGKITFTPKENNKNIIYQWSFGDGNSSNKKEISHNFVKQGEYTVQLITTNTNNNKTDTFKITILANETPKAEFDYYVFDNTYSFKGTECEKQIWKFGDNSFSNEINPEHFYSRIGETVISFTAINKYGCKSETTKTIKIEPVFKIANAFSPNNDGENDEFGPIFENIDNYNYYLYIYNLSGELVFKSNLANQNWNGIITKTNKKAEKGIYLWKLTISDNFGNTINKKGRLTIK